MYTRDTQNGNDIIGWNNAPLKNNMLKNKTEFDKSKTKANVSFFKNDNLNRWYKEKVNIVTIIDM